MDRAHNTSIVSLVSALGLSVLSVGVLALPDQPAVYKPAVLALTDEPFTREILLDSLQSPWAMDFLPEGGLLITEHDGRLLHYSKNGSLHQVADFSDKVAHGSPQLGLLDVGVQKIGEDTSVYLSYTASRNEENQTLYTTCLIRQQWAVRLLIPRQEKAICVTPWGKSSSQFGGAIAFDGHETGLFIGWRQRGSGNSPAP